ncbi:hypothetical protein HMPREF3224_01552 [Anaerococcus hydrogenalis]|nr:hypothetical protein HMPREF3224_01552 [Anaerococcus hydrogenalis]
MGEFKSIDSQEEFDLRIKDRLQRKEEQIRNELSEVINNLKAENKNLKSENSGLKTNLEKVKEKDTEIESLRGQIQGYEKSALKRKVALDYNIPYKLAERIKGENEDEMIEDAKNLSTYFEKEETVAPLKNPEINTGASGLYKDLLDGLDLED